MSSSEWYNNIESAVSNLTTDGLREGIRCFYGQHRSVVEPLFKKKIAKAKSFRPLVFYAGYCLAKGGLIYPDELEAKEKRKIGLLTAAIEAENIATYYINQFLDKKGDIAGEKDERNRVLAGLISRDIAQSLVEKADLNDQVKLRLSGIIKEIDQDIALAQIYDVNTTFDQYDQFKSEAEFMLAYFERCRKISGQFYGRCALMGYIAGVETLYQHPEIDMLCEFYTQAITLLQFANDIGDYALPSLHDGTVEKNFYKDYGSDFLNRRLTYPNYLILKKTEKVCEKLLLHQILSQGFTQTNIQSFNELLVSKNIFQDCLSTLNRNFKQVKKTLTLPTSPLRTLISSSVVIVTHNKLLKAVKKTVQDLTDKDRFEIKNRICRIPPILLKSNLFKLKSILKVGV